MTRLPLIAVLLLAAALAVAALRREGGAEPAPPRPSRCGSCSTTSRTPTTPASTPRRAPGRFARPASSVEIQTPSDPSAPLKLLAAGRVDLAISYEPELLLARDQGQDLVAVGALVQTPLTSVVSIGKRAISSPEQLRGKTVGTAGIPYQSAYLKAILDEAGVDRSSVREVNVGFNLVPAMLSGRVDATLGAFWNYEAIQLSAGAQAPEGHPHGGPSACRPTTSSSSSPAAATCARTASASGASCARSAQGMEAMRKDPAAGVDPLLAANQDLDRRLQTASVEATLDAFFPADSSKPFGWMDARGVGAATRPGCARTACCAAATAARALTNEFLPGEGV